MSIQCGIVGLPNVGKSTLFNALTAAGIAAENYPFCTIDPNVGVVAVPDPRLKVLADIAHPQRVVPAAVEFVDIAGLVAGAAAGEGLGNQFLAHIRETHAIAQVVRCFDDDDVIHVSGRVDPLADLEVIHTELALADLETVERNLQRAEKAAKSAQRDAVAKHAFLARLQQHLAAGDAARSFEVGEAEQPWFRELHLLTAKPVMYIANTDEDGLHGGNAYVEAVRERAQHEGAEVVVVCAALEAEIARLDESEREEFLREMGLEEPGLNRVIRAAYSLLGLQTFFTVGKQEVRAWTYRTGATAPEAAGVIHTDFQRGFIRAEVIAYEDFVPGGEQAAKENGRLRLEGKEYRVREGDVMHFRHNV